MRLGVGGVSFLYRHCRSPSFRFPPRRFVCPGRFVCPVVSFPFSPRRFVILLVSPYFSSPSFRRPRNPPCEQVARRRGAGAVVVVVSSLKLYLKSFVSKMKIK